MPITVTRGAKASSVIVVPRNVRRDGVDKECRKQNNINLKWTGSKGKGLHVSQCKRMPLVRLGLTFFSMLSVTSSAALYKITLLFGFGGSRKLKGA